MEQIDLPPWLRWAREIQAISQTGLAFSTNEYDTQRYTRLAGIAAEMIAANSEFPGEQVLSSFLGQLGYATPKADVRGAVLHQGKILLVQERSDERWCLPGGWADVGESASAMVIREVYEESGLTVKPYKLAGVFDGNRAQLPHELFHAYKMIFLCTIVAGEPQAGDETMAAGFFAFDALPPLSSNRTGPRHLAEVQAHMYDPQRPTAFD